MECKEAVALGQGGGVFDQVAAAEMDKNGWIWGVGKTQLGTRWMNSKGVNSPVDWLDMGGKVGVKDDL